METCLWNVRRRSRMTPSTFMSSATGRSTPAMDTDNADHRTSQRHAADSQCRQLEPPICPGWAAGRSIRTVVWRRRYTRQEQRVLQLCCRHSWQGGAACHRCTGGSEHHGLWWCHPPGCSRRRTTEARAQSPAERRPRASRLVTDGDPAWRTQYGPRGTIGARPAVFL